MGLPIGKVLGALGKLGKGGATIAGGLLGIGGFAFGGGDGMQKCIAMLQEQPASGAALLGGMLMVFGIGRKAGWIASKPQK